MSSHKGTLFLPALLTQPQSPFTSQTSHPLLRGAYPALSDSVKSIPSYKNT